MKIFVLTLFILSRPSDSVFSTIYKSKEKCEAMAVAYNTDVSIGRTWKCMEFIEAKQDKGE